MAEDLEQRVENEVNRCIDLTFAFLGDTLPERMRPAVVLDDRLPTSSYDPVENVITIYLPQDPQKESHVSEGMAYFEEIFHLGTTIYKHNRTTKDEE